MTRIFFELRDPGCELPLKLLVHFQVAQLLRMLQIVRALSLPMPRFHLGGEATPMDSATQPIPSNTSPALLQKMCTIAQALLKEGVRYSMAAEQARYL